MIAASAQPQAPARERLLDALGTLLADRTFTSVRMADVAGEAGVSRQTIYNAFGTREGLALAYVTREASTFVETVRGVVAENAQDPGVALRAALEIFLAAAETHPLVRAISASEEGDELLVLVTTGGGPVIGPVTEALTDTIAETWPVVARETAGLAAETLVRLAISHAALPTGTPAETADRVGRVLGPFIAAEISS